jgi:hypothetical protein
MHSHRWYLLFSSFVAALVSNPSLARAQVPDSSISVMIQSLRDAEVRNRIVRITTSSETLTGRPRLVSNSSFRLGQRNLPTSSIDALDVRFSKPDPPWNGALIGAFAGALILGGAAIGFAEGMSEGEVTGQEKLSYLGGAGLLGIFIGIGVDGAIEDPPEWRTVFTRAR